MSAPVLHLTEAAFQQQVIDLSRALGWRVAHFRPAKTDRGWRTPVQADGAGFPDLVLVRAGELLVVELKGARGRVRPEQRDWLAALTAAGVETHLWRPSDADTLEQRLRARPGARNVTTRATPAVRAFASTLRIGEWFRHPGARVIGEVHQIHRRDRSVTLALHAVRRELAIADLARDWDRISDNDRPAGKRV